MRKPTFARIVATKFATIPSPSGPPRQIQNRNVLLWLYPGAIGVKTGFTTASRFSVVAAAERGGRTLLAIVLGERGEPFADAARLLDYGFKGFSEQHVITDGKPLGERMIAGEETSLASAGSVTALVPKGEQISVVLKIGPATSTPPSGTVGRAILSAGGVMLGQVPVVVLSARLPPPLDQRSFWSGLLSKALGGLGLAARTIPANA